MIETWHIDWIEAKMKKVQLEGSSSWIFRIVQPLKVEKCLTQTPFLSLPVPILQFLKSFKQGAGSQTRVQIENYCKLVKACKCLLAT